MKMNCVFFSDGVQKEMVREVGGGRGEGGGGRWRRDSQVCDEHFGSEKSSWNLNWCKGRPKPC